MAEKKNMIANRYEVVSHAGQGGMADVFLAVDTILNRQVAIKILRADLSGDTTSILRFEREAQAAAALAHPNIVEIYDVGDYKSHHYIVMEYVPGKTLKQLIRSRAPLVNEEAIDIMKQLCSAVGEAHSRGIIHRDIKPQNVIVKADGTIKILDFGIATAKGSMQLTEANNVMGSVHYLAPEIARGGQASPQSDIYALGIVFFEMLASDVPFNADQAVQIALKHLRDPMPSIRSINNNVPQSVENIITKATAKNPAQRYHSADEMLRDINDCLRPERINEKKLILPEIKSKTEEQSGKDDSKKQTTSDSDEKKRRTNAADHKTRPRHGNRLTYILLAILGVLVVAGIAAGIVYRNLQANSTIPSIIGISLNEARTQLEDRGLVLDENQITYKLTTDTEAGIVIDIDPDEGTKVERGSSVAITVSNGIGEVIRNYTGQNINDVVEMLVEQFPYLKVNIEEETSEAAAGTIIRQEQLSEGDLFDPATAGQITLVYSSYPTITIPEDIIGQDIASAVARLEAMGIVVRTSNRDTTQMSQEELDALQIGVVIEASPATGTAYTQKENNYVTLYYY